MSNKPADAPVKKKKDKLPLAVKLHEVAKAINMEGGQSSKIPWKKSFRAIELGTGARVVAEEGPDQTLIVVPIEHLVNAIVAWNRLSEPKWMLTYAQAKEAARYWLAMTEPLLAAGIKPVRWLDEPGYTWRRMPWNSSGDEPVTWNALLSKMTNPWAFRSFIGSLFFFDARQHQYCWVTGSGGEGKGSINRFLAKVFGPTYRSKQPPAPGDKFWSYGLIGARLVVFPDCNAKGFTASGLFKSLTGGDPIDVESKGQMSFTAELMAKFIFLSNEKPTLSREVADMRRIIFCEFANENGHRKPIDPQFELKLWEEGGAFITQCILAYETACPNHEEIVSDDEGEGIKTWISANEEEFEKVFASHFMIPENELYRTSKGLQNLTLKQLDLVSLKPGDLLDILKSEFPNERDQQKDFRNWLRTTHGVEKRSIRYDSTDKKKDSMTHRYVGMALNLKKKNIKSAVSGCRGLVIANSNQDN